MNNKTGTILTTLTTGTNGNYTLSSQDAGHYCIEVIDQRTLASGEKRYLKTYFNVKIRAARLSRNQNATVSHTLYPTSSGSCLSGEGHPMIWIHILSDPSRTAPPSTSISDTSSTGKTLRNSRSGPLMIQTATVPRPLHFTTPSQETICHSMFTTSAVLRASHHQAQL